MWWGHLQGLRRSTQYPYKKRQFRVRVSDVPLGRGRSLPSYSPSTSTTVSSSTRSPKATSRKTLTRKYFQQLISVVSFYHNRGVFHHDLKSDNLLLNENADLKVFDFGLSAVSDRIGQDDLFHTFCGTPSYVAPKVLARKGYGAAKVDI
ncbi:hypothetical protein AHAS_Ahas17G0246600 [Arachis hypogaea]